MKDIGVNVVIGVDIDYEVFGVDNGMFMVIVFGIVVVIEV